MWLFNALVIHLHSKWISFAVLTKKHKIIEMNESFGYVYLTSVISRETDRVPPRNVFLYETYCWQQELINAFQFDSIVSALREYLKNIE